MSIQNYILLFFNAPAKKQMEIEGDKGQPLAADQVRATSIMQLAYAMAVPWVLASFLGLGIQL